MIENIEANSYCIGQTARDVAHGHPIDPSDDRQTRDDVDVLLGEVGMRPLTREQAGRRADFLLQCIQMDIDLIDACPPDLDEIFAQRVKDRLKARIRRTLREVELTVCVMLKPIRTDNKPGRRRWQQDRRRRSGGRNVR
jgi:hypothetical protein